ncbi:cytochrome c oxidase assembly factor CtaG [Cohnella caldifontis]|uniref:cytochrome c oxidase assembly factor CtaG n=1 Tax=Cohnella caldifontis TaxID=3027471 RepID=UPI0023EADA6E|nr:cytochrome c oxidase assembly factor CtaG [Cohnella sp. YIM B05605]
MLGLEYFSFRDLWSPVFLVFMLAVGVLYTFVAGPWRTNFKHSSPVTIGRQVVFLLGVALLYLAQGGPLSLLGHLMFTFHMTDMAISYFIVPPMLIYGIPDWLWKWAFDRSFWRPFRALMNPLIGLFLFNLLFSFYHMPNVHDWIMVHTTVHAAFYFVLFLAAMLNWWHVQCPVPEWARLTPLWRLGYIFGNSIVLTPACVLIIFASKPMFSVYSDPYVWAQAMRYCVSGDPARLLAEFKGGPAFFNLMSAQDDQQLGGILMKLLQEFINIGALFVVFNKWYRQDRERENENDWDESAGALLNRNNL